MSSKQAGAGIPSYRRHKARNLAVVTLNGVDFYLGRYGSPESKAEYDRVVNEWLARGRRPPPKGDGRLLVKELILGYHSHLAETSPDLADKVIQALRLVRETYGETPAEEFGPVAFKAIRLGMVRAGRSITTIRDRMGVIRRMVAWAVESELMPADALQRIQAVAGLRAGRDGVKPRKKVGPAPEADIQAILPHVGPVVRAMVELQSLTGMRPQEIRLCRTGWIDRSDAELWIYRPVRHKTADLGRVREIPLGPRAQEVLKPWLKADPDLPLFSPAESRAAFLADQRARRKTKVQPSQVDRKQKDPKRKPGTMYTRDSYKLAIERGCRKAGVARFTPNQIRHTYATRIRREYGLEAAQVLLGHSKADVTQIYAERNLTLASEIAKQIG
jgi:integrase